MLDWLRSRKRDRAVDRPTSPRVFLPW